MRNLLSIACVGVILTAAWVETATAAPKPPVGGSPERAQNSVACPINFFGKGFFNGSTCEPMIDLYIQELEKSPCPPRCVMKESEERGFKVLAPGESPKKGASCDWAMYDCKRAD